MSNPTPTEAEKVVAELDDETLSPEDSARDLIERFRSGDCPFCGRDPYHYVDNGVGMERVAVVCCDLGIALFQDGDEQLSRAEGERHEAAHALSGLLALIESQRATIERVERERDSMRLAILGGEDMPGVAATVTISDCLTFLRNERSEQRERAEAAEARVTAIEAEKAGLDALLRRMSDALLEVRPLGGSELFMRVGEEYYADPGACTAEIRRLRSDLHEARSALVKERRSRQALSRSSTEVKNDDL